MDFEDKEKILKEMEYHAQLLYEMITKRMAEAIDEAKKLKELTDLHLNSQDKIIRDSAIIFNEQANNFNLAINYSGQKKDNALMEIRSQLYYAVKNIHRQDQTQLHGQAQQSLQNKLLRTAEFATKGLFQNTRYLKESHGLLSSQVPFDKNGQPIYICKGPADDPKSYVFPTKKELQDRGIEFEMKSMSKKSIKKYQKETSKMLEQTIKNTESLRHAIKTDIADMNPTSGSIKDSEIMNIVMGSARVSDIPGLENSADCIQQSMDARKQGITQKQKNQNEMYLANPSMIGYDLGGNDSKNPYRDVAAKQDNIFSERLFEDVEDAEAAWNDRDI